MGFAYTPEEVSRNPAVSLQARALWTILASYLRKGVNSCYPSQAALSEHSGLSARSIRTLLRELETANLIRTQSRGPQKTAAYVFPTHLLRKIHVVQTGSSLPKEGSIRRSLLSKQDANSVIHHLAVADHVRNNPAQPRPVPVDNDDQWPF